MNKYIKIFLGILGGGLAILTAYSFHNDYLFFGTFLLILIFGITFRFKKKYKEFGTGLLISFSIILLIGILTFYTISKLH